MQNQTEWMLAAERRREQIASASRSAVGPRRPNHRSLARQIGWLVLVAALFLAVAVPTVVLAGGGHQVSRRGVFPVPSEPTLASTAGASLLERDETGLRVTLTADDLTPGDAYTLWWLVFDRPEGCSNPCDENDVFDRAGNLAPNPAAHVTLARASARLARTRSATFVAQLPSGVRGAEVVAGGGLEDPMASEVQLLLRSEGPATGGELPSARLERFDGGCAVGACGQTYRAIHQP